MFNNKGKARVLAGMVKRAQMSAGPEDVETTEAPEVGEESAEQTGDAPGMLCHILGMLMAMRQNYHSSHWQVGGPNFYGDHLMFERLYESVEGDIDTLGEKIVAKYGSDQVDGSKLSQIQAHYVGDWSQEQDPVQRGLASEKMFQSTVKGVYDSLKQSGELSLGLDDFLMTMADSHETNEYLLGQRAKGNGGGAPIASVVKPGMRRLG